MSLLGQGVLQTGTHGEGHSCTPGTFWDVALPSLLFLRWGQLCREEDFGFRHPACEEMHQGQLWGVWDGAGGSEQWSEPSQQGCTGLSCAAHCAQTRAASFSSSLLSAAPWGAFNARDFKQPAEVSDAGLRDASMKREKCLSSTESSAGHSCDHWCPWVHPDLPHPMFQVKPKGHQCQEDVGCWGGLSERSNAGKEVNGKKTGQKEK